MKLKPLEDRIVVKADDAEETTASGLVIPDTAKEKPQQGTVMAVGPGRIGDDNDRVPMDISTGARRRGEGDLGPKGRNVVLDKKWGAPTITNDGVSIAKEIELEDPTRTSAPSSSRRSPRRPTTSPVTARPPRPCSPRRWCARACATSPPAPTRWALKRGIEEGRRGRLRRAAAEQAKDVETKERDRPDRVHLRR
jgi:hypothetical protein